MPTPILFDWEPSSYTGWGVYGVNLALHWSLDPDVEPLCCSSMRGDRIAVDPVRMRALGPFFQRSERLQREIRRHSGAALRFNSPTLHALAADFSVAPARRRARVIGKPTVGVTFFETARLKPAAVERMRRFDLVVTGSGWNERVLREHGCETVHTVLQGVDPTLFHPAPAARLLGDRFLVFSGGKLAFRKAQDIVLAAFRVFARRHPDAMLVTAWHSPWPHWAQSVDQSPLVAPVRFADSGRIDVAAWAAANDVPPERVVDLGEVANPFVPTVLREMDVAVFPNRCEGGTNLVAMECMACAVPVILSRNTGHLDLIDGDNCYPLETQGEVPAAEAKVALRPVSTEGWGESSVDELVETLERVYADRDEARTRGRRGAETIAPLTWAESARRLKELVLGAGGRG